MKKVLIFSLAYFPKHVGGAEVSIKEITSRIPDIEFHIVTNRFDSSLKRYEQLAENVYVHRIGIVTKEPTMADLKKFPLSLNKPLYQFLAAWKAFRLHRKYKFGAIWAVMAHSTGVPAAIFKMAHPNVGYVLNLQEGDPPEYIEKKMRPVWPLFKRAFTSADIVQPLSTFLSDWAKRMGYKGHIEIVPNAVNYKHFSGEFKEIVLENRRKVLGYKPDDVLLITTSRHVKKNAIDDVIRAIPLLPENVHFLIGGEGPEEDKARALVSELGVRDRVKFLGQVSHVDMAELLHVCNIFIRPSRSEGFGASFMEAMAAGLPVIATQEGGIADFLFDEKRNPDLPTTGWAVDKDSPEQIAAAVKDIIARPEKATEVVASAKKMVQEKYDWDKIAKDMREKVFTTLFAK